MSAEPNEDLCPSVPLRLVLEDRGFLLAGEVTDEQIPFSVERFFVVGGVPDGEVRGQHAHRHGAQLLVALNGSVVLDAWGGDDHERYVLRDSGSARYVPAGIFTCQSHFSAGGLLLVLCSDRYDANDYIRADEFFADGRDYPHDSPAASMSRAMAKTPGDVHV